MSSVDIDTAEKLNLFCNLTADEIKELKAQLTRVRNDLPGIIELAKYRGAGEGLTRALALDQLGTYAKAVAHKDLETITRMGGQIVREDSSQKDVKTYPISEKAALGSYSLVGDASGMGTTGQYLVPQTIYEALVLRTEFPGGSEIIPLCRNVNMTGRLLRYPAESQAFQFVHVTNESTDKTEKNVTFTYKDLTAETFAGWVGVTDELMEDTNIGIGQLIMQQAIEDLQINVIEKQLLNSNALPATGVIYEAGTVTYRMDDATFDSLEFDDLRLMVAALVTDKQRRGGAFIFHPTVWDLVLGSTDAMGRFFLDSIGKPRMAWGYPILLSDAMPAASASSANTACAIFGNPRYLLHGTRIGLELKYYDQTMYAVQSDQNFFRVRTRQAFKCGIPANFVVAKTAV